jgi:hypothetical protein
MEYRGRGRNDYSVEVLCAAGDSTTLNAMVERAIDAADNLPAPTGGRKDYKDHKGVVSSVHEWFGYKIHLAV